MKFYNFEGVKNISGERIYQARTSRHMTQLELAAKMQLQGVTIEREAISKIETGNRLVTDYLQSVPRHAGLAHGKRIGAAGLWPVAPILYNMWGLDRLLKCL